VLHLLDANVLIDANRDYYAIDRVPEFWLWLIHLGTQGSVKIPLEIYEEITEGKEDNLSAWAKREEVVTALLLDEEVDEDRVRDVVNTGYASDLTDDEYAKLGRDPFLIAYAVPDSQSRSVVTTEGSRPSRQRANRHIPDVCAGFGVATLNTFALVRTLNFNTSDWK